MTDEQRRQQASFLRAQLDDARRHANALASCDDPQLLDEAERSINAALRHLKNLKSQFAPSPGRLL